MNRLILAILLVASAAASASAASAAIDLSALPADRQWLIHLDVATMRNGKIGKWLRAQGLKPEVRKQYGLDAFEAMIGGNLLDVVDDATMSGSSADATSVVCELHGRFDAKLVRSLVLQATDHVEIPHGTHVIHRWRDPTTNKLGAGCLVRDGRLLLSERAEAIAGTLDVIDGKSASMPASAPLAVAAAGAKASPLLIAAAAGMDGWPNQPGSAAMLKEVSALSLFIGERGPSLTCDLRMSATTADAGERIANLAKGLIALAQFNPDVQKDQALATVLREAAIVRDGAAVTGSISYPLDALLTSVETKYGGGIGPGLK